MRKRLLTVLVAVMLIMVFSAQAPAFPILWWELPVAEAVGGPSVWIGTGLMLLGTAAYEVLVYGYATGEIQAPKKSIDRPHPW